MQNFLLGASALIIVLYLAKKYGDSTPPKTGGVG